MSLHTAKETASGLATVSFNGDTDTGLHSSAADTVSLMAGGTTVASYTATTAQVGATAAGGLTLSATASCVSVLKVAVTGSTTTATATFSIANPFSGGAIIKNAYFLVTAASTGAATVDIGIGAAATTGNDSIIDGATVNGVSANTVLSAQNATDAGTNGVGKTATAGKGLYWSSSQFVTFQNKADTTGMTGTLYVTCIPL